MPGRLCDDRSDLQNVTPFNDPGAFTDQAVDPTFMDPHQVLARFPSGPARSPGFVFGTGPGGGAALDSMTWHLPAASIGVRYNGRSYDVAVDGRAAWSGPATVVVQHVSIVPACSPTTMPATPTTRCSP